MEAWRSLVKHSLLCNTIAELLHLWKVMFAGGSSHSIEYFEYQLKLLICCMNWNCKCFPPLLKIMPTDKSTFFLQESYRVFLFHFFFFSTFDILFAIFQLTEQVNFFKLCICILAYAQCVFLPYWTNRTYSIQFYLWRIVVAANWLLL